MRRDDMYRLLSVIIGIAASVALSYVSHRLNLPIYPDAVGTIGVTAIGGIFYGILTAVFTDTLCMAFNGDALYFAIVNVITAIFTAWFVREKNYRKIKNIIIFTLSSGLIGGGLSGIIQWTLFKEPQSEAIADMMERINIQSFVLSFLLFLFINLKIFRTLFLI